MGTYATALLARVCDGSLQWSNAGHPPPVLIAPDGAARLLEAVPDPLLGLGEDSARGDHVVELEPGCTVVFYTDGLIERRSTPLTARLAWLVGLLQGCAGLGPEALCERILAAARRPAWRTTSRCSSCAWTSSWVRAPIGATAVVRDPGWRVPTTRATATGGDGRASSAFGEPSRGRCSTDAGGGTPSSWGAAKAAPAGRQSRVSAASPRGGAGRSRAGCSPARSSSSTAWFDADFGAVSVQSRLDASRRGRAGSGVCPLDLPHAEVSGHTPRQIAARQRDLITARPAPLATGLSDAGDHAPRPGRRAAARPSRRLHVRARPALPRGPGPRRGLGVRPRRRASATSPAGPCSTSHASAPPLIDVVSPRKRTLEGVRVHYCRTLRTARHHHDQRHPGHPLRAPPRRLRRRPDPVPARERPPHGRVQRSRAAGHPGRPGPPQPQDPRPRPSPSTTAAAPAPAAPPRTCSSRSTFRSRS